MHALHPESRRAHAIGRGGRRDGVQMATTGRGRGNRTLDIRQP